MNFRKGKVNTRNTNRGLVQLILELSMWLA